MVKGKLIHVMGTTSNAGKSLVTMGLCRVITKMGYRVTPFKAMNMSLNSIATVDGSEIARSQWLQSKAANILPSWKVNPILLKPEGKGHSQVIFKGKSLGSRSIDQYGEILKKEARTLVENTLKELLLEYDYVIAEGSGSAAEINLYDRDLSNTWLTKEGQGIGIIVSNIENGGAFSSIYGTKMLSEFPDQLKYFVINNMRGKVEMLNAGIEKLEYLTGMKCLGIIPHMDNIKLPGEDSADYKTLSGNKIGIVKYPYFENYSDLDPLIMMGLGKYVVSAEELKEVDSILLPGSKNVQKDMEFLKLNSLDKGIQDFVNAGKKVLGICGGYQILSKNIMDLDLVQLKDKKIDGLKILDTLFVYSNKKTVKQVKYSGTLRGEKFEGEAYEIHYATIEENYENNFVNLHEGPEGSIKGNVIGTNLHGILENPTVFQWFTGTKLEDSYAKLLEKNIEIVASNISSNFDIQKLLNLQSERD
jgi:adenosylcobyric acid synthase